MPVFSLQAYLIAFIGLMISLGGALIAYLISTAGGFPQLKGWAQKEFKELVFSALIIFLGMFLLHHVVLQITLSILNAPPSTDINNPIYFTQAKTFLRILDLSIREIAYKGVFWNSILSGYGGYGITLGVPIPLGGAFVTLSSSFSPIQGLSLIGNFIGETTKTMILSNFAISIMDNLLFFIQTTSFTIFFPLGIILRAFPITRKLGSTIIALTICLFFIFPLTILFNQYLYVNIFMGPLLYDTETPTSLLILEQETTGELQNQIQINESTSPDLTDFDETLINFNEEVEQEKEGWNLITWTKDKIKNFFTKISEWVVKAKEIINNTLNLVFKGTLKIITGWIGSLVQAVFKIDLEQLIERPMHYAIDLTEIAVMKFVFISFCLFLDIIICLTLFANISGVLGGETKIFGIEKLKMG
jgi:hypothetical protein